MTNNKAIKYASNILTTLVKDGYMIDIHKDIKEIEITGKLDRRMIKYMSIFADKVDVIESNDIIIDGFYGTYKVWHFGCLTFKALYTLRYM